MFGTLGEFMPRAYANKARIYSEGATAPVQCSISPVRRRQFDIKQLLKNTNNSALVQVVRSHRQLQLKSQRQRKNKSQQPQASKVAKNNASLQTIDRKTLTKRHQLLKCIVRTQQLRSKLTGSSLLEDSYRRLASGFGRVKIRPITNKEPIQLGDDYMEIDQIKFKKPEYEPVKVGMQPKHRLRLETCRTWAKKHNKDMRWYNNKLGHSSSNSTEKIRSGREHVFGSIKHLLQNH